VFATVAVVTVGAALAASLIPAMRAGRVDPVRALRAD
jgi:ABC-type lipoprotein release transport system permease subunit